MKGWATVCLVALMLLHQDLWFWSDTSLVWGVVPVGLAYHAGISLAATALWFAVARFAWPKDEPPHEEAS
jgi:alpha-D-ribose 1-methylphosphonate 5-triphosphate synthase subunit PhnH